MSRATILIAEDDAVMRKVLQHHLQQAGYVVLSAVNGAEAIERSQAQHIDLVITDLYMPFFNGLEVCRQVHEAPATRTVPVIIVSAPPERLSKDEIAASGIYAWITKPFNPADLLATVEQALRA
ncbi:MAG TPA: response regulator [Herpetosiphonaceae bacterium]|jgi:CheY-like chemotaxis protein|nr:response regulator [Herpetosiphonaceae bacterium]